MKRLMLTLAAVAFCSMAYAQDATNPSGISTAGGGYGAYSYAKFDQVLGRLSLTDEQIEKINAIFAEYNQKLNDFRKENMTQTQTPEGGVIQRMDKDAWNKIREKQVELYAERDEKIREVLTKDQQEKYDLAKALLAEFAEKQKALQADLQVAIKAGAENGAAGNRQEVYKKYSTEVRALYQELNKKLDEEVGALPARQGDANNTPR